MNWVFTLYISDETAYHNQMDFWLICETAEVKNAIKNIFSQRFASYIITEYNYIYNRTAAIVVLPFILYLKLTQ